VIDESSSDLKQVDSKRPIKIQKNGNVIRLQVENYISYELELKLVRHRNEYQENWRGYVGEQEKECH